MLTMRDAFFYRVFEHAKKDPNIIVLTSDFSAPSFDCFRKELPNQFINTGISEQNTILVAAGLAQSGKNVFVTSIAPFITMRCFEQIRLYVGDMNLNIKIIAVGAGFSYNTAGPTHHSVEDLAILRTIPNLRILSPSCNSRVIDFATWCVNNTCPIYVRLDRMTLDELYDNINCSEDNGCYVIKKAPIMIFSTGYMVHTAIKAAQSSDIGVVDIYRIPLQIDSFLNIVSYCSKVITLEEHVFQGGLGSYICEILNDNNILLPVKRFALDFSSGFCHSYGTRDEMHSTCGIGIDQLLSYIKDLIHV
ncbi:MAG: hypothetical protein LBS60_08595 [Deltaproteobacteria bacterium]|jgi:transketolase|nr:hypothetical protein [Deltaproteobacteria bacterium]